jgi:hypothetical protein
MQLSQWHEQQYQTLLPSQNTGDTQALNFLLLQVPSVQSASLAHQTAWKRAVVALRWMPLVFEFCLSTDTLGHHSLQVPQQIHAKHGIGNSWECRKLRKIEHHMMTA